jgi:hypothetical protein
MDLSNFEPQEHRLKKLLKKNKIKLSTASRILDISYSYCSSILSGAIEPSDGISERLNRLVDQLEKEAKEGS